MNTEKLEALTAKWRKAKAKLQKFQAKEAALRVDIDLLLAKDKATTITVNTGTENIKFSRKENYSIPKAAITDIKTLIPKETFNETFTTSYRLKPAVYESLSGECKEAIKKHLTIKPSPLSVSIKEV